MLTCRILLGTVIAVSIAYGRQVCCPGAKCFTDDPPFQNLPLPDCVGDFAVKYLMYTRQNPSIGQSLSKDSNAPSVFRGDRRTVLITHGYLADTEFKWMHDLKDAFLKREDIQVITVDWGQGALRLIYPQAASNTRTVGYNNAQLIQKLLLQAGTNSSRFWCVGHSLGSHVCGHTGMSMPSGLKIGRITGLDPAGPSFESSPDVKIGLNPTAARFVDIIHTDKNILGTSRMLGHQDFFPTGYEFRLTPLGLFDGSAFAVGPVCESVCMHHRSIDFMKDSLLGTDDCFAVTSNCQPVDVVPDVPTSCSTDTTCVSYMGYRAEESCASAVLHYFKVPAGPPFCPRR